MEFLQARQKLRRASEKAKGRTRVRFFCAVDWDCVPIKFFFLVFSTPVREDASKLLLQAPYLGWTWSTCWKVQGVAPV